MKIACEGCNREIEADDICYYELGGKTQSYCADCLLKLVSELPKKSQLEISQDLLKASETPEN